MTRTAAALAVIVALGLLGRLCPVGWYPFDKSLGDVAYAAAVYLVLALLLPRKPPLTLALVALALCLAVELFKFTGVPERLSGWLLARWLLGTTFSWHNLGCYLLGVAVIAGVDQAALRPGRPKG
jgi:hypothetical protein